MTGDIMTAAISRSGRCVLWFVSLSMGLALWAMGAENSYDAGLKLIREEGFKSIDQAIELFKQAVKANASDIPARMALADALIMKYELAEKKDAGWLKDAVANSEEVLRLKPAHPQAYFSIANALLDLGREEDGAKYLKKAVLALPEDEKINLGYFSWLLARARVDEAVRHAAASEKYFQSNPEVLRAYGELFLQSGNAGPALKYLQLAESKVADDEALALMIADAQRMDGKYADALVRYEKIMKSGKPSQDAIFGASYCYAEAGNLAKAVELTGKYLELKPGDLAAMNNLAVYYEKLGRTEDAAKQWKQIAGLPGITPEHKKRAERFLNTQKQK